MAIGLRDGILWIQNWACVTSSPLQCPVNTHKHIDAYIHVCRGVRGVTVTIIGNGHGDQSSNSEWDYLHMCIYNNQIYDPSSNSGQDYLHMCVYNNQIYVYNNQIYDPSSNSDIWPEFKFKTRLFAYVCLQQSDNIYSNPDTIKKCIFYGNQLSNRCRRRKALNSKLTLSHILPIVWVLGKYIHKHILSLSLSLSHTHTHIHTHTLTHTHTCSHTHVWAQTYTYSQTHAKNTYVYKYGDSFWGTHMRVRANTQKHKRAMYA